MKNCLVNHIILAIIFLVLRNSSSSNAVILKRPILSVGFLFQRTVSIDQKSCSCTKESSCSCCQSVTILLRGVSKNFCINFGYQQTGLTMNISLGSNVIRQAAITDYKPFKVCTAIPDCPYSSACVDVLELTLFPRSITICIQLEVTSKIEKWLINYNCISISTILTNQATANATTIVPLTTTSIVLNGTTGMNDLQPTNMPATSQMNTSQVGMTPTTTQMSAQIPAGQMPMGQMPMGQMPPGQMQGSLIRRSGTRGYVNRRKLVLEKNLLKDVELLREEPFDSRRGYFDKKKYIFGKVYHRSRRNTDNEKRTASVKMQVINRRVKNGLPRMRIGPMIKIPKNWIGSAQRSSRIVNQDTISIPMSQGELGNTVTPSIASTTPANGVNYEFILPQPGPFSPPLQGGVFLGGGTASMDEQIFPNFLINVDNRTSSFPNRMPPSFGAVSRIRPTDGGKTLLTERSVEELVTPGARVELGANSKIVETSSTDFTDGRIIFPE